ncbi:T9SS type A sorting domain-containing protein [Hymenobacter sp. BT507]|uniref:T9SS type A sorting domain-containing protein n=1 Tax=Hymenobacter citatus TaxID=2763506 RepID=A0ABR7MHI7_9BACT|nr:T9SS type A sorting domain-containing protein [Hymenobacter citatus]MBC6610534.1 T9SS type A sorting domain-containing protein [Hymenobacter citatus]
MNTFTRLFLVGLFMSVRLTLLAMPVTAQSSVTPPAATTSASESARSLTSTLSLYPNPARGMVMVSITQKAGQEYKLRLSNILGREVRTVALQPAPGEFSMPVNLSDLPAGMYFYSLLMNEKVVSTKRLVLQN